MQVETLEGLERKLTVSVPSEKLEEEVGLRLRSLARKVKMDGFRPGKVPLDLVKKRFSNSVREEVARELISSTLSEAFKENHIKPASTPHIEPQQLEENKDFIYNAYFEVFPKFDINEIGQAEIEVIRAEVTDKDIAEMLEKLREQNKEWREVSRAAAKDDKLIIDFKGFINDTPFEGGSAKENEIILGSGSMIPGFEEGLIGAKKDENLEINLTFPKDYGHQELAGKEATFKIKVHQVMEGKLPLLDAAFAEKFNVKEGGMEALTKDLKENMIRELERRIDAINREKIFEKLRSLNPFELPKGLIDQEIENLKHEMYHRLFGHEHSDNEKIPDFPRNLFEEQAKQRVHLGLLVSEYIKKHELVADEARINEMIEKFAKAYDHPEALRSWYQSDKKRLAEVEAMVLEQMVAEKASENATLIEKAKKYIEIMNPAKEASIGE